MRLFRLITIVVLLSAGLHAATLWLAPRTFMALAISRIQDQGAPFNRMIHPPRLNASSRNIVRPSPELLYSICIFDLSDGPVRITAGDMPRTYWSISGFAANTDNFFVVNDRDAKGKPVEIVLTHDAMEDHGQAIVVDTPSTRGLVLIRMVIENDAALPALDRARRGTSCARDSV